MNESETELSGQRVGISPPEGGDATPTKELERYLRFGAAGEVIHGSDLPRNAETEVT
jgi:hypothetical protein